jgi:hypothetical protein
MHAVMPQRTHHLWPRRKFAAPLGARPVVHQVQAAGAPTVDTHRTKPLDAVEEMIDRALDMTFPASDPPAWSIPEPGVPPGLNDIPAAT